MLAIAVRNPVERPASYPLPDSRTAIASTSAGPVDSGGGRTSRCHDGNIHRNFMTTFGSMRDRWGDTDSISRKVSCFRASEFQLLALALASRLSVGEYRTELDRGAIYERMQA